MKKQQLTVFPGRLSPKLRKNIDIKHRDRKVSELPPYFVLSLQAELNEWQSTCTIHLLLRQITCTQLQCSRPPTTQTETEHQNAIAEWCALYLYKFSTLSISMRKKIYYVLVCSLYLHHIQSDWLLFTVVFHHHLQQHF